MKHPEETEAVEIEALGITRSSCGKHAQEQIETTIQLRPD